MMQGFSKRPMGICRKLRFAVMLGIVLTPLCSYAENWQILIPNSLSIDLDSIHEDQNPRLPAVDREGHPLLGKNFAATLRQQQSADLVPYSPDDPKAKKYITVWDTHEAIYFFYCNSDRPLMSLHAGQVVDHLRGQLMRAYDDETLLPLKVRGFLDWTNWGAGIFAGPNGGAAKAGKLVCEKANHSKSD